MLGDQLGMKRRLETDTGLGHETVAIKGISVFPLFSEKQKCLLPLPRPMPLWGFRTKIWSSTSKVYMWWCARAHPNISGYIVTTDFGIVFSLLPVKCNQWWHCCLYEYSAQKINDWLITNDSAMPVRSQWCFHSLVNADCMLCTVNDEWMCSVLYNAMTRQCRKWMNEQRMDGHLWSRRRPVVLTAKLQRLTSGGCWSVGCNNCGWNNKQLT